MSQLRLEDLTKDELLWLIHRYFFGVPQRSIMDARWHTLTKEASAIMDGAQKKLEANVGGGIENIRLFQQASREFDKGMVLSDRADKLWEELMSVK